MHLNQGYSDPVLGKVETLATRVHLLKERMAKQRINVKLEHYWELEYLRSRFGEFKWRVEQLEEDDELQLKRDQDVIEASWNELMRAVDILLDALPDTMKTYGRLM
jgi:hypothetical protein